jgi:hypothetical protein
MFSNLFLNLTQSPFLDKFKHPHFPYEIAELSYEEVWRLSKRINHWGIEGYEAPRFYQDPLKQMKDRDNVNIKKGQKDKRYVCKKGHYLEDLDKMYRYIPSPNTYKTTTDWVNEKNRDRKIKHPDRQTFLDVVVKSAKSNKFPGPAEYYKTKTDAEIKKEQKDKQKQPQK